MSNRDREFKGLLVFSSLGIIIIIIGVIMAFMHESAAGQVGGKSNKMWASLPGSQVILLGVIMLALALGAHLGFHRKKKS